MPAPHAVRGTNCGLHLQYSLAALYSQASDREHPCRVMRAAAPEQWQSQQRIESCNRKKRSLQYTSAATEAVFTRAARRSRPATRASRAQTSTTRWTRLASSPPRRAAQPLTAGMSMLTGKCIEVTALRRAASDVWREQAGQARVLMPARAAPGDGGREHAGRPVRGARRAVAGLLRERARAAGCAGSGQPRATLLRGMGARSEVSCAAECLWV